MGGVTESSTGGWVFPETPGEKAQKESRSLAYTLKLLIRDLQAAGVPLSDELLHAAKRLT